MPTRYGGNNEMSIIESFIDKYYFYHIEILITLIIIFNIVIIGGLIYFKINKENIRYIVNQLIYKAIFSAIIVGIGALLCLSGLILEIEYFYFNALFFIMIFGGSIVYGIILCLMFKKIILPIMQSCKYIIFAIFFELLLLVFTQHLELLEWITGTLGIISIEMLAILLDKLMGMQEEKEKGKEYDYPNADLYPTRKKQLEKFITVLKQQEHEPYAVMISGQWGTGKSSFVLALEKRLNNNFIWIYAGSEKTVTEIMSEISAKIVGVLKKNNIFIENKNLIEKYFLAFSYLAEYTAFKPLKKMTRILFPDKYVDDREYLNNKLDDLSQPIYLIIDDLDRCDSEYQEKMFKVIRESLELHNCKTIFLVDKNKFICEEHDANYIEKYVSYTMYLCDVDYEEIVEYFVYDIFDDEFVHNMNDVLLKNRDTKQIREIIYKFPLKIIERLENEMSREMAEIEKKKGNEGTVAQEKIKEIEQAILDIKKSIIVSRKIKNYLKGVRRSIGKLNNGIEKSSKEYQREDWLISILEVQFVKNFMSETFHDIRICKNIYEYSHKNKGYVIFLVFGLYYGFLFHNEEKEQILNFLIYKLDVIDFAKVETMREKYLSELRQGNSKIISLHKYLEFAETYEDLYMILNMYKMQFNNSVSQEDFINNIFSLLHEQYSIFAANSEEFLSFSKHLMSCLLGMGLTDKERNMCIRQGNLIVRRAIVDNSEIFINLLSIIFDINIVEEYWKNLSVTDINELYIVLNKIDNNQRFQGLDDDINKLMSIEVYYGNLMNELRNEKYKNIGLDLEKVFRKLKVIFEICHYWEDIEYTINDINSTEKPSLLKKYFIVEYGYLCREEVFDDVTDLVDAIIVLKDFYESSKNNYKPEYSFLLLRLSYKIVLRYEENSGWYREKKKEVVKLLMETAELVYRLDKMTEPYSEDCISKIKIYTYKFKEYSEGE